jgi:hypothetical protein
MMDDDGGVGGDEGRTPSIEVLPPTLEKPAREGFLDGVVASC